MAAGASKLTKQIKGNKLDQVIETKRAECGMTPHLALYLLPNSR